MFVYRKSCRSSARHGLLAILRVACPLLCSLHSFTVLANCAVRAEGLRLSEVLVRPAQAEPLLLNLGSLYVPYPGVESAIVTLPDAVGGAATLQVLGAIAFQGTRKNPVFSIRQKITTNHGMVQILPGALFSQAHSEGRTVLGTLSFAFDDTDDPWRYVTLGESVGTVRVPCEAFGFPGPVDAEASWVDELYAQAGGDADFLRVRQPSSRVVLRSEPRWNSAWAVLVRGPLQGDSQFSFRRLAEHAGWVRVLHVGEGWGAQAALTGWVRRSELEPAEEYRVDSGIDQADPPGACGYRHEGPAPLAPAYEGRAGILVGTKIYAEPKHWPWATVRQEAEFYVKYFPGETWAWVLGIPGITMAKCGQPMRAYVPVSTLILPKPVTP